MNSPLILVTGATGYIASRLIPRLLSKGYHIRVMARRPESLMGREWLSDVEIVSADVTRPESLVPALEGVDTAYYLIHSMARGRGYIPVETRAAHNFASVAEKAGLAHIIYLGGLADPEAENIAPHMLSRIETGNTLRQGSVPVTEFRAGVIVGPGSISFEMIRFLTECFPILPGPAWLKNKAQPVATHNVIDYLAAALDHPEARGGIYEIGGPDVMHYKDTMLRYAELRGLKRWLFTLPGIPICLMARFVDWLTPVPASIAFPLVGGLQSDSIVLDEAARSVFPEVELAPYRQAVCDSLNDLSPQRLERVWEGLGRETVDVKHEGFFVDYRRVKVETSQDVVFHFLLCMGGSRGWPYANWLWSLRGWLDWSLGGPGRRGGPVDGSDLSKGDALDYYRVEALEPNHLLRLFSELRAPGDGWMEWQVETESSQLSILTQTAFFAPRGLSGFLYWYLLYPLHTFVFRGLLRSIKEKSEGL